MRYDVELAQVALATLGTMLMIGLGLLHRPNRATILWSLAFAFAMLSSYVQIAAAIGEIEWLRLLSLGTLLASPVFVWSGLRALRGAASLAWVALPFAVAAASALVMAADSVAYPWVFRAVYAASATFAGLTVLELVRRPERGGGVAYPLSLFSVGFTILAAIGLVSGAFMPIVGREMILALRPINMIGMLMYIVCAAVSLLLIIRNDGGGIVPTSTSLARFTAVASDRFARAQSAGERSWAVMVIALDEQNNLRIAAGDAGFAGLASRFADAVRDALPADADIVRLGPARFGVVFTRPVPVVNAQTVEVLAQVAQLDAAPTVAVRLSASIGWVIASDHSWDAVAAINSAEGTTASAHAAGGNRALRGVAV